ncbi:hypothetical protein RRG08_012943 [Elysia crispata]|uniref:Uncharacterized protein n=1 Tax=Elysia crispata TaxID=231223 RepID=A0AAE0ZZW5_9GAST|nr:hypothetical protein RRG08_012943 [Elysia crispata]
MQPYWLFPAKTDAHDDTDGNFGRGGGEGGIEGNSALARVTGDATGLYQGGPTGASFGALPSGPSRHVLRHECAKTREMLRQSKIGSLTYRP